MTEAPIVISTAASEAACSIANFCATRFPDSLPPSEILDVPWFAEKVQLAIDKRTKEYADVTCRLSMQRAECLRFIDDNCECQCEREATERSFVCPKCSFMERMNQAEIDAAPPVRQ